MDTKDTNPKDLVGQTKAQLWLIPPAATIAMAEALTDGARKYQPYNWREKGVRTSVYISAAQRHILAYLDGEDVANDSGVNHLGHAMACFAIVLDSIAQGNIVDDRPTKGKASELLEAVHKKAEAGRVIDAYAVAPKYSARDHGFIDPRSLCSVNEFKGNNNQ